MPYIDEFGEEWEHKTAYIGAALKLACPNGQPVAVLIRVGDQEIRYQVAGSGSPELPWPPEPHLADYWERCPCDECGGRRVGAPTEELRSEVDAITATNRVNQDTYFLRYLDTARDAVIADSQLTRYTIYRDSSTNTDTYLRAGRRVAVRYEPTSYDVAEVTVVLPTNGGTYPATIAGARAALRAAGN